MRKWTGYVLLIASSTLIGWAAGLYTPWAAGWRGPLLGLLSALALVILDELEMARLGTRHPRRLTAGPGLALAAGCLVGLGWLLIGSPPADAPLALGALPPEAAWQELLLAASFCLPLYLVYELRRLSRWLLLLTPWLTGFTGMGMYLLWDLALQPQADLNSSLLSALIAALPYSFLWGVSAALWDPAFEARRWQRACGASGQHATTTEDE